MPQLVKRLGGVNVERTDVELEPFQQELSDSEREAIRQQFDRQQSPVMPVVIELPIERGTGPQKSAAKPKVESEAARAEKRQKAILPLLRNMGWSRNKWATKAGVEFKTVANYLKGITTPSPETCKCLAEVLGIPVDKLPV